MSLSFAYLDAGSGSLIVQALVAGTAGAAVVLKLSWHRLTGAFPYLALRAEGGGRILPLVMDLANPSGIGWRNREGAPCLERAAGAERFTVERGQALPSGTRGLYAVAPRG